MNYGQFDQMMQGAASQFAQTGAAPADTVAAAPTGFKAIENMSFDDLISRMVSGLVDFAIHLAIAILVFYVGKFIIGRIYKIVSSIFIRRKLDRSLAVFILSLIRMLLYFILVVTVIGILGIETSSFLAIFASAGVAIGLALSGTLQNFAGGVLILLLKPYKIGDYIEAQGFSGTVKEIQIFSTIINTPDNKQIIIPNGPLSTSSINNYSKEDYRRVDWTVSIAYGDDVEAAKTAILDMLLSDSRVVQKYVEDDRTRRSHGEPSGEVAGDDNRESVTEAPVRVARWRRMFGGKKKISELSRSAEVDSAAVHAAMSARVARAPFVALQTLNSSSVDLVVRAWTPSQYYWDLYFEMNERFYKELPGKGLHFPFPQMDVHLQHGDA